MDWIWQDYSTENVYICDYIVNPYFEVYSDYDKSDIFYVNTAIRFDNIFEDMKLLDVKDISEYENPYEFFEESRSCSISNIMVHYLAHLDMLDGITADKLAMDIIRQEIEENLYGKEINRLFNSSDITDSERDLILWLMLKRYRNDMKEPVLAQIFTDFFDTRRYAIPYNETTDNISVPAGEIIGTVVKPAPEIYYRKSNETVYYYCADIKGFKDKFRLLRLIFSDIEENITDVWGKCFGIIGSSFYSGSYPQIDGIRLI